MYLSAFIYPHGKISTALTRWLWKLATANSAVDLSVKVISATMAGLLATIRQLRIGPVVGSNADWISAAVVPGAKFVPITTNGPDAPLIEKVLLRLLAYWASPRVWFRFPFELKALWTWSAFTRSLVAFPRDRTFDGDGVLLAFPVADEVRYRIKPMIRKSSQWQSHLQSRDFSYLGHSDPAC